jgi:hypothetical protein
MAAQVPQEFNGTITFMNYGSEKLFSSDNEQINEEIFK